jgi:hypothetical protein
LADDQNEQAEPEASQHSVEDSWNNYLARVNESIVATEQHLEVPTGTISSIPNDPDFIAAVKMYAVIEPILNDLITSWQSQTPPLWRARRATVSPIPLDQIAHFRAFVTALNIRGGAGKLKLAKGLGLIVRDRVNFISAVADVRNRYAHNVKNMHRSLTDVVTELQRGNKRIVEHLTGINLAGVRPPNEPLKQLMYYRLADYLSAALHTLRPPPLPESQARVLLGLGQARTMLGLGPHLFVSPPEGRSPNDDGDETER